MLDKSVEYKNIIMRIKKERAKKAEEPMLPAGFRFHFFSGIQDVKRWSGIETSVLEFTAEAEAEEYFLKSYFPQEEKLKDRCLFISDSSGRFVATATAWYADSALGHQASLHWVAVRPEVQRLGLGKAVVLRALQVFNELEPNCDIWLHTQTWSHTAVRLYHNLGFTMVKQDQLANMNTRDGIPKAYPNDFTEAVAVLEKIMDKTKISELVRTAV